MTRVQFLVQAAVWAVSLCVLAAETRVGAAAANEPWADAIGRAASVVPPAPVPLPLPAAAGDLYLTPDGAGARTGADWANALPGNASNVLQAAWDALQPGRTCHLGSGLFVNLSLKVSSGGSGPAAPKRLAGEDTGEGLPWLVGDWSPKNVEHGASFLSLGAGVGHCAFEHLRLARYHHVMFSKEGRHVGLRLRDVGAYELRFGVFLCGGGLADKPEEASHDIAIEACPFIHFSKSAVRLQGGNYDVRVLDCTADAGGSAWMKEAFHIATSKATQRATPRRTRRRGPASATSCSSTAWPATASTPRPATGRVTASARSAASGISPSSTVQRSTAPTAAGT